MLIIRASKDSSVSVGSLGRLDFESGFYAYVGSAQNNLERRIERHLGTAKKKFWHIDYLLDDSNVEILETLMRRAGKTEECRIARRLGREEIPILRFGSSDCKCKSHLFKIKGCEFSREHARGTAVRIA